MPVFQVLVLLTQVVKGCQIRLRKKRRMIYMSWYLLIKKKTTNKNKNLLGKDCGIARLLNTFFLIVLEE